MHFRPPRAATATAVAGAALVSALAGLGAAPAQAAPTIPDAAAQPSLDIHKFNGLMDSSNPNDGRQLTAAQKDNLNLLGTPMAGVAFDVYPIDGVDLTTNDGWRAASALNGVRLSPAEVAKGELVGADGVTYRLGPPTQVVTDTDGNARFTGNVALYLVAENRSASKLTEEAKNGLTPAAPFLVTLPMTDPTSQSGWDYTVDVYPKNQVDTIVKIVRDANRGVADQDTYRVGQNLTYHLSSSLNVSDSNDDGKLTGDDLGYYYAVIDELDKNLQFASATVDVLSPDWRTSTRLVEGEDYVLRHADGRVTVSMLGSGLDVLAANGGGSVETDLVATVATMPAGGIIPNTASFVPSNTWLQGHNQTPRKPGDDAPKGSKEIPSAKVETKFGDLVIQKRGYVPGIENDWGQGPALAGAEFAVFAADPDGSCGPAGDQEPIATSAPTDAAGFTMVEGLALSNFGNNSEVTDPARIRTYCVVETKAPAGYDLLADPVRFELTVPGDVVDASAAFADQARDPNVFDGEGGNLAVVDVKKPALPIAGDRGTAGWSLAGLAVVGGGAYLLVSVRKRRRGAEGTGREVDSPAG